MRERGREEGGRREDRGGLGKTSSLLSPSCLSLCSEARNMSRIPLTRFSPNFYRNALKNINTISDKGCHKADQ